MSSFAPITAENYQPAFLLQQQSHYQPWSEAVFTDCLHAPYFSYQLSVDEQVVGYYIGLAVSVEATLMDIGIAAQYRGRGLGKQCLLDFITQARERQCQEAWLEVRQSNTSAIALYRQTGFVLIETRKDYYPTKTGRENGLIMRADI